jgi:hypothetical protein
VGLDITGGLVISTSLGLPAVPEEEDDADGADVITMDALLTNPVIDAKSAAAPSSIASALLALIVGRDRGARGLVFTILIGFSVCSCGAGSGRFRF